MTLGISSNVLLAYLQARTGQTGSADASASAATTLASSAPVAPWNVTTTTPKNGKTTASTNSSTTTNTTSLVASLLAGNSIVNPSNTKLSTTTSNAQANNDYKSLFTLFQGLTSLQTLANAAGASDVSSSELNQLEDAFSIGLSQVRGFISSDPFDEFQVADGTIATQEESTTGAQQSSDTYVTQPLVSGSPNTVISSLQGNVSFSVTASSLEGQQTTVNFDLSQMGSTPRTLANVISYMNSQMAAAGLKTRFSDSLIPGASPTSTTTDGVTTTTPGTPNQYALQIVGTPNEMLSFSAPTTSPAVYIAQTSTDPTATSSSSATATTSAVALPTTTSTGTSGTSTTAPTTTSQFLKLDPATGGSGAARAFTDDLPDGSTVTGTATAPDGSVYVLANVTGPINGQPIQGQSDAVLLKYDSAGNLVYTRTLGASDTADATAIAVSADGSQVAIAGSITGGALDPGDASSTSSASQGDSTTQQSFVTVFDSSGDELWSQTQDAGADNQVNAVAFGANNSVYVAGQTQGRLPDASGGGATQNGYIQGFSASSVTDPTTQQTTWTAQPTFTTELGSTGINRATGIAVEGSSLYVSSVLNGDAVVQQYSLGSSGTATLAGQQDLGAVDGGNLSGLTVAADGSIVVAGSTHNAALSGTITSAYSGDGDAFVADLNANLNSTTGDTLAYFNDGAPTTASALTVSGGQVYITGQLAGATSTTGSTGYAAAIDPTTGQVSWQTTFTGNNGSSEPASIAVSSGGDSVLDALGLPQGQVLQQEQPSQLVVANSAVQAGDEFFVQSGSGQPVKVTVDANDTYQTLAQKIEQASGFEASVSTITINGQEELKIAPANSGSKIRLEAGPAGQDALEPLGLQEGLLDTSANSTTKSTATTIKTSHGEIPASNVKTQYQITVPASLSLSSPSDIATAQNAINVAIAEIKQVYTDLTTPKATSTNGGTGTGHVPSFITAQIANYQQALERLTGSSSSSTSGSGTSGSGSVALSILAG